MKSTHPIRNVDHRSPDDWHGRNLESSLQRIVRCVIRRGRATSPLGKRILAMAKDARRVPATERQSEQGLIDRVCRGICQEITSQRSPASVLGVRTLETLRARGTDRALLP